MARDSFLKTAAPLVVMTFLGVYNLTPPNAMMSETEKLQSEHSVHYAGCDEVRASGKAPLYRGDPGYREGMDGDSDGIACEPY
jgi:Excalibur calcium-binding domain